MEKGHRIKRIEKKAHQKGQQTEHEHIKKAFEDSIFHTMNQDPILIGQLFKDITHFAHFKFGLTKKEKR